jgi:hypothetical protein
MGRHRGAGFGAALLAGCLATAAAAADSLVVADARGGSLTPGQTIDAGQSLKLEAGQRVTLIATNGATIKLSGPFEGVPDPGGQRNVTVADALAKLATQSAQSTATLGAVRAPEGGEAPDPWLVDVSASGHRCIAKGAEVVLWRPPAAAEDTMALSPSDHAWEGKAKWPGGADRLRLPADFQAQDDAAYIVAVGGKTSTITFHLLPPAIASDPMRAAWMIDKGCAGQAKLLVSRLK